MSKYKAISFCVNKQIMWVSKRNYKFLYDKHYEKDWMTFCIFQNVFYPNWLWSGTRLGVVRVGVLTQNLQHIDKQNEKKVNQYRQLRYSLTKRQSKPRSHLFSYLVFFILWYNAHIYMHKVLYTEKLFIAILLSGQYFIAKSKLSVFHILIDYL